MKLCNISDNNLYDEIKIFYKYVKIFIIFSAIMLIYHCLLYTSDAADDIGQV